MSNTSEWSFVAGDSPHRDEDAIGRAVVERTVGGHAYPHGRPRSWVLVAVVIAAFCAGGAAIIAHVWPLFWACAGVALLSLPAGKVIGILDDTVEVGVDDAVEVGAWPGEPGQTAVSQGLAGSPRRGR